MGGPNERLMDRRVSLGQDVNTRIKSSVKAIAPKDFGAPRALLAIAPKSVGAPRADLAIAPKCAGAPM